VWPRKVIAATFDADALGSIRVMCLAVEPVASKWTPCISINEERGCSVVLVSTSLEVVRSQVRTLWSQELE
jgi:hypothetical protein